MAKKRRKKKVPEKPSNNGHAELIRSLWEAAVALRGSIEPADYKRYVLPLIFLRFLSLRYERRRAELEKLIADPDSDYHTKDAAEAAEILTDEDEYRAAGAFVVPEDARWFNIIKMAQADDLKIQLDNILDLLEKTYPQQLRGLLPRIYAGSNMDRDHLAGLINLFSRDVFTFDHGGEDLVGRVYEYFIGEFANSEGKAASVERLTHAHSLTPWIVASQPFHCRLPGSCLETPRLTSAPLLSPNPCQPWPRSAASRSDLTDRRPTSRWRRPPCLEQRQ